jgi:hypothetical protein
MAELLQTRALAHCSWDFVIVKRTECARDVYHNETQPMVGWTDIGLAGRMDISQMLLRVPLYRTCHLKTRRPCHFRRAWKATVIRQSFPQPQSFSQLATPCLVS